MFNEDTIGWLEEMLNKSLASPYADSVKTVCISADGDVYKPLPTNVIRVLNGDLLFPSPEDDLVFRHGTGEVTEEPGNNGADERCELRYFGERLYFRGKANCVVSEGVNKKLVSLAIRAYESLYLGDIGSMYRGMKIVSAEKENLLQRNIIPKQNITKFSVVKPMEL